MKEKNDVNPERGKAVCVHLSMNEWEDWKKTGLRGTFVFLKGIQFPEIERELIEKQQTITKLENAINKLQSELLQRDSENARLGSTNLKLQKDLIDLEKEINSK
jgi:hypothetical protein